MRTHMFLCRNKKLDIFPVKKYLIYSCDVCTPAQPKNYVSCHDDGTCRGIRKILLCFRHLSESRFLLDALHRRSKFANICYDLKQNYLS